MIKDTLNLKVRPYYTFSIINCTTSDAISLEGDIYIDFVKALDQNEIEDLKENIHNEQSQSIITKKTKK